MIYVKKYVANIKIVMQIEILKSKLHRATVTNVHLEYEGSCAIDQALLESAKINEYEHLHIYNLNNGNRFTTYAIKAERDSGIISFNGAAAYQGKVNDKVIICRPFIISQRLFILKKIQILLKTSRTVLMNKQK